MQFMEHYLAYLKYRIIFPIKIAIKESQVKISSTTNNYENDTYRDFLKYLIIIYLILF